MDGKRKRGRPVKDQNELKRHRIVVRMDDKEWEELTDLSRKTDLSKAEVIRMSIAHYNWVIRD